MAKIGLKYPICGKLTEGVTNTYTEKTVIGKAIKADIKITKSNTKLHADDGIAEFETSVTGATINLEVDELSDKSYTFLMGHKKVGETEELVANGKDTAPFVGFGFYGAKMINNVTKYRAIFFPKVKFSEPDDSNATKGESTTFQTQTIEGEIVLSEDGTWKYEQTFATEAEAKSYLEEKFEAAA